MLHGILLCSCLGLASAPGASAPLQSATGTQTGTGASSEALAKADSAIGSDRETALVRATRSASGSVAAVVVTSNEVVPRRYADPMLDYFFGAPPPEVRQSRSWGSGVLVDSSGHILTNFHVVEAAATPRNAASISVTLPDGRRFQAAFVGGDPDNDLAVLRITGTSLPVARVASRPPVIGEWVLAIGNPFGHLIDDPRPTVTAGVVSAVDRSFSPQSGIALRHVLQTDASINPGNSGGALVNALGEVVGINTFILTGGGQSMGSIGLGFAIPIGRAMRIVEEIVTFGRVRDFRTGLSTDPQVARALGLGRGEGVLVSEVENGSPGAKAGIRPGDVIVALDGRPVADLEELRSVLRLLRVGDRVGLKIKRKQDVLDLTMVLEEALQRGRK